MKESSTYQYILDEGRIEQAQQDLILLGRKRFGTPGKATENALKSVSDLDRLKRMMSRLLDVSSWHDLMETR